MAADDRTIIVDPLVGNQRRDRPLIGRWRFEEDDLEALRAALDWPHARTRRADRVEEALVAEALHVGRFCWISYSRRKEWYASAAPFYLPEGFTYRFMTVAVDRLGDFGLFDHDRKKPSSQSRGFQSRFRASARLAAVATKLLLRLRCGPPRSPLIVRDKAGHPVPFEETDWTRAAARNVAEIEEMLASVRPDLAPDTPCMWRCGDFLEVANRHGDPHPVHVAHVPICRIFKGDWECGGRFCGPPYQSWPQRVRAHITLDGAPTEELDYGQTHARMLCARAGLDIDATDLYRLPGFQRDQVKEMFNILLNTPDLLAAQRAFADGKPKGSYDLAGKIADAFKARHPALAQYLHTNAGLGLMRLESDVAEEVLLNLARRGIAALPVHESFVVATQNADLSEQVMRDAWSRLVGSNAVVSRKA